MLFLETVEVCKNPNILRVLYFGKVLLGILSVIIPIYLIITITINIFKEIINSSEKKVNWKLYKNKILCAIIIFIVPWTVNLFMNIINEKTDYVSCLANANLDTIDIYQRLEDIRLEEERKKKEEEHNQQNFNPNPNPNSNPNSNLNKPNCTQLESRTFSNPSDYINFVAPYAINESKKSHILPSVLIAQTVGETGWGKKPLPGTNNMYNMQCGSLWQGKKYYLRLQNGKKICFRAYDCMEDSFEDHSKMFDNSNYTDAKVTETRNYKEQMRRMLYDTKYAYANPKDPVFEMWVKIVEQNNLTKFDK